MSKVLCTVQREQAGSDSYNRFEYQVHWIVYHIVKEIGQNSSDVVFCEFHDDMSQRREGEEIKYDFYQIKTNDTFSEWTIARMSKRDKKKDGTYKKSFLGYMFANFLMFESECNNCYFVSNKDFDIDIKTWQAIIEDEMLLKEENNELYEKLKERIKQEYENDSLQNFDETYDNFIQHTFVRKSELQLESYEKQVEGFFFECMRDRDIPTNAAFSLFEQILTLVRRKSKNEVQIPISYTRLVEEKGIRVNEIEEKLDNKIQSQGKYKEFENYLVSRGMDKNNIDLMIECKRTIDSKILAITNLKDQKIILHIRELILVNNVQNTNNTKFDNFVVECMKSLENEGLSSMWLTKSLIEVLVYEYCYENSKRD